MAQKKWFTKGTQAVSSTAPTDQIQFLYEGFTKHDSEAAAKAAVEDAAKAEQDADKSPADTGGKPAPTPQAPGSKPKA